MPADVPAHQPAAVIATHALRAFASMAAFDSARAELEHSQALLADIGALLVAGPGQAAAACPAGPCLLLECLPRNESYPP